jgi:SDR family mycofactocin-dependent oxidoreductase
MGKLDGKVAFISGGARGQGRSHAVRLAEEGADIITFDICAQIEGVPYEMSNPQDLEETRSQVEALGRRIVAEQADARDIEAVRKVIEKGVAEIGPIDIVVANAGIGIGGANSADSDWTDVIDVNLTGVWNTVRLVIPSLIERGVGGSIIITSSTGGMMGVGNIDPGMLAYTASKHAVVGLMRAWANHLAPHYVRVNSVAPTAVNSPMAANDSMKATLDANPVMAAAWMNPIPVMWVETIDISNAVAFLASDESRYITGTVLPVDAGLLNKV